MRLNYFNKEMFEVKICDITIEDAMQINEIFVFGYYTNIIITK